MFIPPYMYTLISYDYDHDDVLQVKARAYKIMLRSSVVDVTTPISIYDTGSYDTTSERPEVSTAMWFGKGYYLSI